MSCLRRSESRFEGAAARRVGARGVQWMAGRIGPCRPRALTRRWSLGGFLEVIPKPRVVRHEPPWVRRGKRASTPTGLRQRETVQTQPRWGWVRYGGCVPRVGAVRQPWALVQNPVGIPGWMRRRAAPTAPTSSRNVQTPGSCPLTGGGARHFGVGQGAVCSRCCPPLSHPEAAVEGRSL